MKKLITFLIALCPILSFSQINFEPGYIIRNNNIRTECLIRNIAWKDNPTTIEYKITENEAPQILAIAEITEFSVSNAYKFKRFTVQIDRSSNNMKDITSSRDPKFKTETLLLKAIVEGSVNLYAYEDSNLVRYFVSTDNPNEVTQLVYKEFFNDKENAIAKNNYYRQQLSIILKSDNLTDQDFKNVEYKQGSLVKLFEKYYGSKENSLSNLSQNQVKGSFNFKIIAGASFVSAKMEHLQLLNTLTEFDSKTVANFGVEVEYILPFNKNKWSLFFNPTYQGKYESSYEKEILYTGGLIHKSTIEYSSIDLNIGARHYMFLNQKSKIFLGTGFTMAFPLNSSATFRSETLEITKAHNLFAGGGFAYNRFSAEIRCNFKRSIISGNWGSNYNSVGILAGYKFL